ncbi:hypothetical protein PG997_005709 [Apiospora hydei]|uniref:Uncharacterized protein n=1 Tax=Apiospora hydei TaxID=1337664 RepID=A0ABR1WQZ5_9PEZI
MAFRGLQRLNIIRLQNDIARIKRSGWDEEQISKAQSEQHTANAIKDYEYLDKLVPVSDSVAERQRLDLEQAFKKEVGTLPSDSGAYRRLPDATFLPSDPLRDALKDHLPKSLTYTEREIERRGTTEYLKGHEPPEEVSPSSTSWRGSSSRSSGARRSWSLCLLCGYLM